MYYILLEDFHYRCPMTVTTRQFRGANIVLKAGSIFIDFYGTEIVNNVEYTVVSSHSRDILGGRVYIKSDLLFCIDPINTSNSVYISKLTGDRYDILRDRTDYRITGVGPNINPGENLNYTLVSNTNVLKVIMKELKDTDTTFDKFKYKPVASGHTLGFLKDGKFIVAFKDFDNKICLDFPKKNIKYFNGSVKPLLEFCQFKVINYIESAKLFKFTEAKKKLVGKIVNIENIELNAEVKSSTEKHDTLFVLTEEGKRLRFLLSDIEIIYPNINGYNIPKDRSIKEGEIVRIKDDRRISIKRNEQVKVLKVKTVGNKKYAQIESRTKQKLYTPLNKLRVL